MSLHDTEATPPKVEAWLTANVRPATVTTYEVMTGGFSRAMARVEVRWEDGQTGLLVLRGDPPPDQAVLETDRDAEWSLLEALSGRKDLPVPSAHWYVDDNALFGTKAIFMEFVDGGSLQAQLDAGADQAPIADRFVDLMGDVASIDPTELPASMPRPDDWASYMDAAVGRWRALADSYVEAMPITRYIAAWLDKRRPPPLPLRLVHGDFQPGNIVVGADGWRLCDWEFSRIGDPREDLGYYNAYAAAVPPNLCELDLDRYLSRFRERTGFSEEAVNPITFGYFTVLSTVPVVENMYRASSDMANGTRHGVSVAFNSTLITIGNRNFMDAVDQMEAAISAAEEAG